MSRSPTVVQYWAGCPRSANAKWRRFLAIVQRCRAEGWRSCLIWSQMPEDSALVAPFREASCDIVLQPRSRGNFDRASAWRTYRLLRRLQCDVFHCYNDHTSPLIGAALARVPVRVWSKLAMSPFYERGIQPTGLHRLAVSSRLSCSLATRVLARSEAVKQELIAEGARPENIQITSVDVDVSLYQGDSTSDLRNELGLSPSNVIITAVGHAVPVKGWDVLLNSFRYIHRAHPEARLLLVGQIPSANEHMFAESLREKANQSDLADCVRFLGRRDDIPAIMLGSDIFVMPSRSEGQPGALAEALAAGLPCVATRAGGIPELIEDGSNGLLVDREDEDALAKAVVTLIDDKELQQDLSVQARLSAAHFDIGPSTERLMRVYMDLMVGNG